MNRGHYFPPGYKSILSLKETEHAIKKVKDSFQVSLASELRLRRVTAPIFVLQGTGINDDLNGVERPVSFPVKCMNEQVAEVVHSLAKWKRMKLADYDIEMGYGIYTDMNALRPDEEMDNLHSLYVDQWDWERVISEDQRNLKFLKNIVLRIYQSFKRTEFLMYESYPELKPELPDEITFIHSQELLEMYPTLSPKEREDKIAEKYGAVFIIGIGGVLSNGESHDGRAPDYDDWTTPNEDGYIGLNGDILLWNPLLQCGFEISSMGIRVDRAAMLKQLELTGQQHRKDLMFHKRLLNNELPLSIGGGIGQSRLCMYLLKKAHIGEIQASVWPQEMVDECTANNIFLV
jgi:aspartate--ammonia ligase